MKPIIFSTPMVQAILAGQKTQTRRVVKPQPDGDYVKQWIDLFEPPYKPGDRLWVKEAWSVWEHRPDDLPIRYRADYRNDYKAKWQSPMFMPRRYSRITLEITNVRCERLQEMTEADAVAEGLKVSAAGHYYNYHNKRPHTDFGCPIESFESLWDSINAKRGYGWETNPWVWVLEFRVGSGRQ